MAIGTLTGTFLAPGWSKNRRYYSPDLIADSAADMQERLASGNPIPMMGCHETSSTLEQVAAIRKVWTDDQGRGRYEAAIPDTTAGRDLLALTTPDPETGERFLNSVSIYGGWVGDVRTFEKDGTVGTTGDQLRITRVDFVDDPGVEAARLDAESAPAPGEAELIESLESFSPITESAPPAHFHDLVEDGPAATVTEDAPPGLTLEAGAVSTGTIVPARAPSARDQLAAIVAAATEAMVRIDAFASNPDDMRAPVTDVQLTSYGSDDGGIAAQATALGRAADAAIAAASATPDAPDTTDEPVAVLCSACAGALPGDASYCPACGSLVSLGAESAPTGEVSEMSQTVAELGPTKCGGCGGDVPSSAKFCPNCGAETKTKDADKESAPATQEVPVTEQTGGDLAAQIAAGIAEAFKQVGIAAPATEAAPAAAPSPTPAAPAAEAAPTTSVTEKSVAEQIAEALAAQRETDAAARAEEQKALVAGIASGISGLRDEIRTEMQSAGVGGQRQGFAGGGKAERLAELPPREAVDLSKLTAPERERVMQEYIADQIYASGVGGPAQAEAVRTQHRYAG